MKKSLLQSALFFAILLSVFSCKKSSTSDGNNSGGNGNGSLQTDSLYVKLSVDSVVKNGFDRVQISVKDKNGNDITASCSILANGMYTISTNYLPTLYMGSYNITALVSGANIPSTTAKLKILPSPYKKKILVEDCTGAWCGYCPRVAFALETYKASHPNCISIAVHGGGGTDPMKFQYYSSFNSQFAVGGYPTGILNRKKQADGTYDWSENTSDLDKALNEGVPLGLSINSTVDGSNVIGSVKVKFGINTTNPMKVVIAYVENGIVYPQTNYYAPTYGANPIANFVHNGVLRRTSTNLFGDMIPQGSIALDNVYEVPFNIPITGSTSAGTYTSDPTKSAIVAFVVDGSTGSPAGIYNVQYAAVGSTVGFGD